MKRNEFRRLEKEIISIKKGEIPASEEEIFLVSELFYLMQRDKGRKIMQVIINSNYKFKYLVKSINCVISEYMNEIDRINRSNMVNKEAKIAFYKNKINNLDSLKNEIVEFLEDQINSNGIERSILEKKCIDSLLIDGKIPRFNDESLAYIGTNNGEKTYYLNERVIHSFNSVFQNDSMMENICGITRLIKEREKYYLDMNECKNALFLKGDIYNNSNTIIKYDNYHSYLNELYSKINDYNYYTITAKLEKIKRRMALFNRNIVSYKFHKREYNKLEREKFILENKLIDYEFLKKEIIFVEYKLRKLKKQLDESNLKVVFDNPEYSSLKTRLEKIRTKEEIDDYYKEITILSRNISNELMINELEIKDYLDNSSNEVISFVKNNYHEANTMRELYEYQGEGISPKVAMFVLESYYKVRDMKLDDMHISQDEYNKLVEYYQNILNAGFRQFNKKFVSIIEAKKGNEYIKK